MAGVSGRLFTPTGLRYRINSTPGMIQKRSRQGGTQAGDDREFVYPDVMYGVVGTTEGLDKVDVRAFSHKAGIVIRKQEGP
jgi:hypothetical protein